MSGTWFSFKFKGGNDEGGKGKSSKKGNAVPTSILAVLLILATTALVLAVTNLANNIFG